MIRISRKLQVNGLAAAMTAATASVPAGTAVVDSVTDGSWR